MPISAARRAAFEILLRVEEQGAYASELLHSERLAALSAADRGLCTELVMGALRWQAALDDDIQAVSSQKLNRIDAEVLVALRLGAYQLRFLDRIPAHAAVNESVELVKRARKKSAAPFANAGLRKLIGKYKCGDGKTTTDGFVRDAEAESPEALAAAWAHPPWLVARWVVEFGSQRAHRMVSQQSAGVRAALEKLARCGIHVLRRRDWTDQPDAQAAVYANRRRIRGVRGKRLMRQRGELIERSLAHSYETGAMRRTHLRHPHNIAKRLLVHVGGFNLGLVMRRLMGIGKPRRLQGLLPSILQVVFDLWSVLATIWTPLKIVTTGKSIQPLVCLAA